MTEEKRYMLKEDDDGFIIIWDTKTEDEIGFNSQVVNLLNEQDKFIKNLIVGTNQLSGMLHKDKIVEKIKELEDEARYSKDLVHGDVWDRKTNIVYCDVDSIIELLNKQEQKIGQLTRHNRYLIVNNERLDKLDRKQFQQIKEQNKENRALRYLLGYYYDNDEIDKMIMEVMNDD